jgi:hypothetical protein
MSVVWSADSDMTWTLVGWEAVVGGAPCGCLWRGRSVVGCVWGVATWGRDAVSGLQWWLDRIGLVMARAVSVSCAIIRHHVELGLDTHLSTQPFSTPIASRVCGGEGARRLG